jgi:hypothetical protein
MAYDFRVEQVPSSWNRRCANNGFVFVREVGKLGPALGHCHENRGTLKRKGSLRIVISAHQCRTCASDCAALGASPM